MEEVLPLGRRDHTQADSILDAAAGVSRFELGDDGALQASSQSIELHEGRVPYRLRDIAENLHGPGPRLRPPTVSGTASFSLLFPAVMVCDSD